MICSVGNFWGICSASCCNHVILSLCQPFCRIQWILLVLILFDFSTAFVILWTLCFLSFSPPLTSKGTYFFFGLFLTCFALLFLLQFSPLLLPVAWGSPQGCLISVWPLLSTHHQNLFKSWSNSQSISPISTHICSFIFCHLAGLGECS